MCSSVNANCKKIKITLFRHFLLKQTKTSTAKYNIKSVTCVTCVPCWRYPATSQEFWNLTQRQSIWSLTWWTTVFFYLRFHRDLEEEEDLNESDYQDALKKDSFLPQMQDMEEDDTGLPTLPPELNHVGTSHNPYPHYSPCLQIQRW